MAQKHLATQGDLFYDACSYLEARIKSQIDDYDHGQYIRAILTEDSASLLLAYPQIDSEDFFLLLNTLFNLTLDPAYISQMNLNSKPCRVSITISEGLSPYIFYQYNLSDYLKRYFGENQYERDVRVENELARAFNNMLRSKVFSGSRVKKLISENLTDFWMFVQDITNEHYFLTNQDLVCLVRESAIHFIANPYCFQRTGEKKFSLNLASHSINYLWNPTRQK